jgi:hypothetical protein
MSAVLANNPATMKISDLQTGFRILSRLPLANSHQAQLEINNFLDSLLQAPPPGDVYLQLLEQTRISLCFIEEQLARATPTRHCHWATSRKSRFSGRSLPPG